MLSIAKKPFPCNSISLNSGSAGFTQAFVITKATLLEVVESEVGKHKRLPLKMATSRNNKKHNPMSYCAFLLPYSTWMETGNPLGQSSLCHGVSFQVFSKGLKTELYRRTVNAKTFFPSFFCFNWDILFF